MAKTVLFNPGPGIYVSPTGGVAGPGETFSADSKEAQIAAALERGRVKVQPKPPKTTPDPGPTTPPATDPPEESE